MNQAATQPAATNHPIDLDTAAALLGVGARTLRREMRGRGMLSDRNFPTPEYKTNHYFDVQQREWIHPISGDRMPYYVTLVLPLGMCLISQIAQDIRTGNKQAA